MFRKKYQMVGLSLVMMLTGCQKREEPQQEAGYAMMKIVTSESSLTSRYTASIRGKSDIDIYPQVSGYITEVCVEEGEAVRKGQTLFVIDQVPYQAALRTAQANVNLARAQVNTAQLTFDSKQELYNKQVVSSFERQTAANALESAKAQLEQALAQEVNAKNNYSYTLVKSPSDGVVGTLPFKVGTLVSPSQPRALTRVSDNREMYVYFSMTENQLLSLLRQYESVANALQSMPAVRLELSDKSLYAESGRIETISGVIDESTGAVTLCAVFPNQRGLLHSGGSGNVHIPSSHPNSIVIPKSATFEVQDQLFVYRNIDGHAKSTRIAVAQVNDEGNYIVESGLQPGDVIITEGVGFIRENTPVLAKSETVGTPVQPATSLLGAK